MLISPCPGSADFDAALDALCAGKPQMVWSRILVDTETPVSIYLKLCQPDSPSFLLESVEGGAVRGRYSLVGLEPDRIFRAVGTTAEINSNPTADPDGFVACPALALDVLRAEAAACRMTVPEGLPDAIACLVGYFSYETAGQTETLPPPKADALGVPDMLFIRPSLILVIDRLADEMFLIAPEYPRLDQSFDRAAAQLALERASARIGAAVRRLESANVTQDCVAQPAAQLIQSALDAPAHANVEPQSYRDMVARAKDYILAGDIFQVVLAQRFSRPFPLPPVDLYRALRRINPSPFLYLLAMPGFAVIGSSPEILVRVRHGEVTVRPIAGTRPRGRTGAEDKANRASLLADPKERAEHLMLLDLGRNDVSRVSQPGTVDVTESFGVETYSHVMHIVSNVRGTLNERHDAIDALMAGFPAGTVSGAPKVRAMEIIHELEAEKRGAYAGGVGYFAPDGSLDSCIVLRTAIVKDGVMHVQAGAGIVADSDPDYELAECKTKAGALMAAARTALTLALERMGLTPQGNVS